MKKLFALAVMVVVLASCAFAQYSPYSILQFPKERLDAVGGLLHPSQDTTAWYAGYYHTITLTTRDYILATNKADRNIYVQYKYFFKNTATTWDSSIVTRLLVPRGLDSLKQAYAYDITGYDSTVTGGHCWRGFRSFRVITEAIKDSLDIQHQLFFLK